uniref:Secreted protein n=1 Tax=Arundo donax TaxID=35708 RepID=A0A0A9G6T4_ARUDO
MYRKRVILVLQLMIILGTSPEMLIMQAGTDIYERNRLAYIRTCMFRHRNIAKNSHLICISYPVSSC